MKTQAKTQSTLFPERDAPARAHAPHVLDPIGPLGPVPVPEWLETDGLGAYSASTPWLCPTRRTHGLLVAPTPGTTERHVFVARCEEVLREPKGRGWAASLARYGAGYSPRGDRALEAFDHAPWPRAAYRLGEAELSREICMPRSSVAGSHAVLVRYALLESDGPRTLELRPVLPFREANALTIENDALDQTCAPIAGGIACRLYAALPALSITTSKPVPFESDPVWFRDLVFEADVRRGYSGREDEFGPGAFFVPLAPGEDVIVAFALGTPIADPRAAWTSEVRRRTKAAASAREPRHDGGDGADPVTARLERAADSFLYHAPDGRSGVLAGFPWFVEWGRDTFLSLPGLTLARGRLDVCAEALKGALPYLKRGLMPNVFGATPADSHYNSADAALWFARAVLLYVRAGGSRRLVARELRPALEAIAEAYQEGTELGLFVDEEGLLHAGTPELNPTWMDARVAAGPVTPRHGCPVEIAALWCSLLATLEELVPTAAGKREFARRRRAARRTFLARFWVPKKGILADVWRDGERDLSVRPNMVLAAALELAPLSQAQRGAIVRRAKAELLTPRGLRTLSPRAEGYVGRYGGGPEERDRAYHQGTVWPWLLGPYTEAALRAGRPNKARLAELAELWRGLEPELDRAGLDHVSEVFDGDPPHAPGGTFAQAWNTAEWLRARRMLAEGHA